MATDAAARIRKTIKRCSLGGNPPAAVMLERTDVEAVLDDHDRLLATCSQMLERIDRLTDAGTGDDDAAHTFERREAWRAVIAKAKVKP